MRLHLRSIPGNGPTSVHRQRSAVVAAFAAHRVVGPYPGADPVGGLSA